MFDKENYKDIKSKKTLLLNKHQELMKLQQEIYEIKVDIKKTCKHDLILVYNIIYDMDSDAEDYRSAHCLICDNFIKVKYITFIGAEDFYYRCSKNEKIDDDNIIDITKFIPEEHRNYYVTGKNELVIKAQEVLNEILKNNLDISKKDLKELIKNRLIDFCKERESILKKVYKKD